jgi:hypothetical protein
MSDTARLKSQNYYLRRFLPRQKVYLSRLLRNEAPPIDNQCTSCHVRQCHWRCKDCLGGAAQCTECFRDTHRLLPFHRVENWTGTHFEPAWLFQAGVEIHLGHNGIPCPTRQGSTAGPSDHATSDGYSSHPSPIGSFGQGESTGWTQHNWSDDEDWEDEEDVELGNSNYGLPRLTGDDGCVIVDRSGVHQLKVHLCLCPGCPPKDVQYFDLGLFPASLQKVKTAFTFAVLDDFRMDNLECKTSGLKYYSKLRRLTSNCFPQSVPVSSPASAPREMSPSKCHSIIGQI